VEETVETTLPREDQTLHVAHGSQHPSAEVDAALQRYGHKKHVCGMLQSIRRWGHLFFKCKEAKELWRAVGLEQTRSVLKEIQNPREVVHHILGLDTLTQVRVVTLLWTWWAERNRYREGEKECRVSDMAFMVTHQAYEFVEISKSKSGVSDGGVAPKIWKKPNPDNLKINSDGAFFPSDGMGSWGYVIRDQDGQVVRKVKARKNTSLMLSMQKCWREHDGPCSCSGEGNDEGGP